MKNEGFNFDNFEERKSEEFHNFKEIETVEGILLEIRESEDGNMFLLEKEDGKKVLVGSYATLQKKLTSQDLNHPVQITYTGEQKSLTSKKTYMNFKVIVAP